LESSRSIRGGVDPIQRSFLRGSVDVDGEKVGYSCYVIDVRDDARYLKNKTENTLEGNLVVYLPGHVQPADAARHLHTAIVQASRAGVLWSIDIDPPQGGDPTKAAALRMILQQQVMNSLFEDPADALESFKVTIFGWSHGGAEALRAAELAPEMIDCVIALCSAGLDSLSALRLIGLLPREVARITRDAFRSRRQTLRPSLRFGAQLTRGFAADLLHTRSPRRLANDLRWVGKKVVGPHYGYRGNVVIVLSENDTFFSWRRLFPDCDRLEDLPNHLEQYCQIDFPRAKRVDLQVLPGNHLAPELHAPDYLQAALGSMRQMGIDL
jgi:pimeloyl-ACP methyl ester carboxylesterase